EDFARCRLLIKGFGQLVVQFLQLREQPDVLDRDYGLVGEGLQQGDLRVRKRCDRLPTHRDGADWVAVSEHGHRQDGTKSRGDENALFEVRICRDVRYVDHRSCKDGARCHAPTTHGTREDAPEEVVLDETAMCGDVDQGT